jgi:hypothetical protein
MKRYGGIDAIADPDLNDDFQTLRWFPLPGEIHAELQGQPVEQHGMLSLTHKS